MVCRSCVILEVVMVIAVWKLVGLVMVCIRYKCCVICVMCVMCDVCACVCVCVCVCRLRCEGVWMGRWRKRNMG